MCNVQHVKSCLQVNVFFFQASTVVFSQSAYSVNEDSGQAQPVLVLSNPSSTDITVQVSTTNGSATGEYVNYLTKMYNWLLISRY